MDEATETFLLIEAIFNDALAVPQEERAALIELRCQGDRGIRSEVLSLLKACEVEEHLRESRRLAPETSREQQPESKAVGPYVLDRLLGRGGMGAVYLAHRADGQFEQQVAIKLIDLPLATGLYKERFRQERQILAQLHHPYIARLLDGGETRSGDLYLVMEYVDGVPITRFCDQQKLSLTQRLELFLRVSEAVEFAHQNFIVHRDLKPDNILVVADGTPRLLDFGTAKLLSASAAKPANELTREGHQSFTPQYASPEQVLNQPITSASDTYSLGVLLYLLATGTAPYELNELTAAEMLRVICEEPPRRPAHSAGSNKRLDADLEAILLKSLRKEPDQRYRTAEQLASDLRAYLDGKPVGARQGTMRYRAAKFIRRHRWGLAAVAVLAATLVAGVLGVLWQARVANQQRRKAEARSADLRQLSNSLLSELDEAIKELPGSTGAQKLLVTRVLEHLDRMAKDAQGDRQTQLDLIDAYTRLGDIQGNAYDQNLGDPAGALVSLGKAIDLAEPLAGSGSRDREAIRALALAEESRSEILWQTGKTPEAVSVMRIAVRNFDALAADPHASAALLAEVGAAHGSLADELGAPGLQSLGDERGAVSEYEKDLLLINRALQVDPKLMRARRSLIIAPYKIADIELETDPAQAFKDFQAALQRIEALPKAEQEALSMTRMRTIVLRKEALVMIQLGEYSEANARFAPIVSSFQHLAAADPQDVRALEDLHVVLDNMSEGFEDAADPALAVAGGSRRKNLAAAQNLLAQQLNVLNKMLKLDPSNESWKELSAYAQVRLATAQTILHSNGDAGTLAKTGIAVLRDYAKNGQASPLTLDRAANAFLIVEPAALRDPQFAVSCAERAVVLSHRQTPSMLLTLAQAYRAAGQTEKSRATAREGLALLPALQPGSVKPRIRKLLEIQAQTAR